MSVILHSKTTRKGPSGKHCTHYEASILGFHYEADKDSIFRSTYKLHLSGRPPSASDKVKYTISTDHFSIVTRRNTETEELERYRVSMYGDLWIVYRVYDDFKIAAYSIVRGDSGYRLSVTGKPLNILFPSWDANKIQEEVSHAFDVGFLKMEIREADSTWEAIEEPSMDEDAEFCSYELLEDSEWDDLHDIVPNTDSRKVSCVA